MLDSLITIGKHGAVRRLTLSPEHAGELTPELVAQIADAVARVADDGQARVAVLDGEHGLFTMGWSRSTVEASADPALLRRLSATLQAVAETPLPVIAAIQGDAIGAGLELALACDVRLAAETARFGFPASARGLLPLGGGAARLARIAGRGAALRMLLTGELLSATEALACGLVSAVYPEDQLTAEAGRLAGVIASRGPLAVRYAKEAISRGTEMPLDQALRFETDLTVILQTTADRAEGVRAFAEKREPQFTGE